MLETVNPREQSGRDSYSRYRAQVRAAAMAALSILEHQEIDRVYCDLHDDYVVRKNIKGVIRYIFYQVKTNSKSNHNWTLNEVFGLKSSLKHQGHLCDAEIKNSFAGKLLLHTVVFESFCEAVVFQTNIHTNDGVEDIISDIKSGAFKNKFSQILLNRFNQIFDDHLTTTVETPQVKDSLAKLKFETDVPHLKGGAHNFEPLAREQIYRYSEVDLGHEETKEILLKLLDLVSNKSSGVIEELTAESIEEFAAISIDDLLSVLSISKDAYKSLITGGDSKAIKTVSIIQRTLLASGADNRHVEYCSRCKTNWDQWLRRNRLVLPEMDILNITDKIRSLLNAMQNSDGKISFQTLRAPIKKLVNELKSNDVLYDLNEDLILGGIFSELVRVKS